MAFAAPEMLLAICSAANCCGDGVGSARQFHTATERTKAAIQKIERSVGTLA